MLVMTFIPLLYFQLLKLHSVIDFQSIATYLYVPIPLTLTDLIVYYSPVFLQGNRGTDYLIWLTYISFSLNGLENFNFSGGIFNIYDPFLE